MKHRMALLLLLSSLLSTFGVAQQLSLSPVLDLRADFANPQEVSSINQITYHAPSDLFFISTPSSLRVAGGKIQTWGGLYAYQRIQAGPNETWQFRWKALPQHPFYPPKLSDVSLSGKPVIWNDSVVISGSTHGSLYLFDLHTGALLPQGEINTRKGRTDPYKSSNIDTTPAIYGDVLYYIADVPVAVDLKTKKVLWRATHDSELYPPFRMPENIPLVVNGELYYLCSYNMCVLDIQTGKLLKKFDHQLFDDSPQVYGFWNYPVLDNDGELVMAVHHPATIIKIDPKSRDISFAKAVNLPHELKLKSNALRMTEVHIINQQYVFKTANNELAFMRKPIKNIHDLWESPHRTKFHRLSSSNSADLKTHLLLANNILYVGDFKNIYAFSVNQQQTVSTPVPLLPTDSVGDLVQANNQVYVFSRQGQVFKINALEN